MSSLSEYGFGETIGMTEIGPAGNLLPEPNSGLLRLVRHCDMPEAARWSFEVKA
jgi:hypothetical protein